MTIEYDLDFAAIDERVRTAVEAVASHDPDPRDPFRGLYISDDLAVALASGPSDVLRARLEESARLLSLDILDTAALAVCAAPQLSPRYSRLYGYLHDDLTRKLASPRLVARLLTGADVEVNDVLACFSAEAPLRQTGAIRLLDNGGPTPLPERSIQIADRLAAFLIGHSLNEPVTDGRLRRVSLPEFEVGRHEVIDELRALMREQTELPLVVAGADAVELLAVALGRSMLVVDAAFVSDADTMNDAALVCALEKRYRCFDGLAALEPSQARRAASVLAASHERPLLAVATRDEAAVLGELTVLVVESVLPSVGERRTAWSALAGTADVADVAAKFRLSMRQIAEAAEVARLAAVTAGDGVPSPSDLDRGARHASSSRLGELARRLEPAFEWRDLVLPERQRDVLVSISAYLRHRDLVLFEWGYERTVARTQGLKVLFAGDSGTGKTMAAQVLAHELGLDLFRIDLATIVSKYIGETEKNLDRLFSAAEDSNAILFFDEADALFGKRSEVRDSHDRYANIEVAYLLQKMESYAGAVILATNYRQNIDGAFLRRLDVVVDFPFPEADDRRRIWQLVLPDAAPVSDDLDLDFLATQFKLAGGGIRNCSLAAAFMAAEDGGRIAMHHLVRAVALEYEKLGRLTLESDFERFHKLVRGGNVV